MGDDGGQRDDAGSTAALANQLRALAGSTALTSTGREHVLRQAAARLESLRDERDRLRATIDRALIGIFRTSLTDGRILYSNHRNATMLGYDSPEDSMSNMRASTNAYVHPEERDEMRRRITTEGHVDQFRTAVYCKDGSVKHVVFSARLYPELGFLEGTMADDTDRVEKERELKQLGETLRQQNARLKAQRDAIIRLSAPVIEIGHGVLCVPMIGAMSAERFRVVMEQTLAAVVTTQARVVLLELTAAELEGPDSAAHLVKLARAARLLGSKIILAGLRPALARQLAELTVTLDGIETCATLRDGLARLTTSGPPRARRAEHDPRRPGNEQATTR